MNLPMETAAHDGNPEGYNRPGSSPPAVWRIAAHYHTEPNFEWLDINWIRVYKTQTASLQDSTLVTDTQNTVALVGDKVAIAVNVTVKGNRPGLGFWLYAKLGLGVKTDNDGDPVTRTITYNVQWILPAGIGGTTQPTLKVYNTDSPADYTEGRRGTLPAGLVAALGRIKTESDTWIRARTINRLPRWEIEPKNALQDQVLAANATKTHTLIYEFDVKQEHVDELNEDKAEGGWLKAESYWDTDRTSNEVQPFNTFTSGGNHRRFFRSYSPARQEFHIDKDPPTYDATTNPIHYPRLFKRVAATPEIDVPAGTQTGAFTVTLRFHEDYEYEEFKLINPVVPVPYETGEADIFETLQTALAAGVEHGTVEVSRPDEDEDAVSPPPREFQVTVVPILGFVGEITLQVPADTVKVAATGLGNVASASVTVPIDTPLPQVEAQSEVVAPESGTYRAGDELTVEVSFATDGLTFAGENPPYVIIYLGEQVAANARHALWQQGKERSGSTIVPFVYTVHADDPTVSSVSVAIDSSDGLNSLRVPRDTRLMAASGINRPGTADPAATAGAAAPVSETLPDTEPTPFEVTVEPQEPVIWIPQDESDPKAAASSVPRTPIVFNELGNGSGDTNDWLELHNVTGSAVSLKDWELSVVADGKKEDTSLIVFADVSVPANGLLLITNMPSDKTPLAGGANKGLSHASLDNASLSLPDDGKFLLILRNAKEKLGLNEAFIDVAGGGGSGTDAFIREQTGLYDTHVWPLQVREAPGGDTEDALSAGKVWQRANEKIVGYHKDAWAEAAFTGLGYDRKVKPSDPMAAGTPGYPNGAVKTGEATPQGAVTFSEIMFDTAGATLPQWIELYNNSKTEALNLNRWKLEIQNRNSEDLVGRPIVTLTLQEKVIQPNQTLLIVAGDARASSENVFPADRVYNLLKLHDKNLRIKSARDAFLSAEGFYLKLSDSNGTKIDEIGNLDDNRRTDGAPLWVMPVSGMEDARSSLVRRYTKGVAESGTERSGWAVAAHFKQFKVADLHYGHADDIGTPGYRQGGALPVELSSFTVTRTEAGAVVVAWTTESEVDNAGFNLRRSLQRDSGFTLLNPTLIAGAGTTGERQTYTFTDTSAKPGVEYYYQIEEVSFGGKREALVTRRLAGPVSPANRALTTFGEVKQAK